MSDELLEVRNVSLAFGGVRALSDVSFDVRRREVRAIIGPNGAGKSSMLNVLNGVYHPQQGTIRFENLEFSNMDPHRAAARCAPSSAPTAPARARCSTCSTASTIRRLER